MAEATEDIINAHSLEEAIAGNFLRDGIFMAPAHASWGEGGEGTKVVLVRISWRHIGFKDATHKGFRISLDKM